jgi:hypothetical protein
MPSDEVSGFKQRAEGHEGRRKKKKRKKKNEKKKKKNLSLPV